MMRHWQMDGAWNVRDLGGYPAAGGRTTCWRRLLRSDGLHRLSGETVADLVTKGVRTVIDLRGPHETEANVNPFRDCLGVAYRVIPLFDALSPVDILSESEMEGYQLVDRYLEALTTCRGSFGAVFAAMADADEGIVLFHCTAGKDRTGLVAALLLGLAGVSEEHILQDYLLTGTVGAPLLERLRVNALRRGATPAAVEAILAVDAHAMTTVLEHVAALGGAQQYLRECGLPDVALVRLRQRLTEPLNLRLRREM